VLLLAMAGFIIFRGIERLQNPMEVPSLPMFIMAVGGIGLEIASLFIMYKGQKESLNIRGSFWHVMNAFLGSIAVIIAATFISLWQIYVADAWAGILFAVILVWAAYGIIRDSFIILVDGYDRTPFSVPLTMRVFV
jgi:cobalt-zinc-cadmium efflux system protein